MAREPTDRQQRIMDTARNIFDLHWAQATGDSTINFEVTLEEEPQLRRLMSLLGYDVWREWGEKPGDISTAPDGFVDISFKKE